MHVRKVKGYLSFYSDLHIIIKLMWPPLQQRFARFGTERYDTSEFAPSFDTNDELSSREYALTNWRTNKQITNNMAFLAFQRPFLSSPVVNSNSGSLELAEQSPESGISALPSGQRRADNGGPVESGFPTEQALATDMPGLFPFPNGPLMCSTMVPITEAGHVLSLKLQRQRTGYLPGNEHILLSTDNGSKFAGGAHFRRFAKALSLPYHEGSRFMLYDGAGAPVALCVQGSHKMERYYTFFGRTPLHSGDEALEVDDPSNDSELSVPLDFYPWFRVLDQGACSLLYRPVRVWNGSTFDPLCQAMAVPQSHKGPVEAVSNHLGLKPCYNVLLVDLDVDRSLGYMIQTGRNDWELVVAPGVDPAVVLCLGVVLNDMVHRILFC